MRSRISADEVPPSFGSHVFVRHRGNLDVEVDTVEQRPVYLAQVSLNLRSRAATFAGGVAQEAAPARVHVTNAT